MACFCDLDRNTLITSVIFFAKTFFNLGGICFDSIHFFFGYKNIADCFSCNGIIFLSTSHGNNLIICFSFESIQKTPHDYIGICSFFVNLRTGMTTHQAAYFYLKFFSFCVYACNRDMADSRKSTGTTDPEAALCFRVHIDHTFTLEYTAVKPYSTKKTDFFIYSDQHFQCWMWQICTVKKCQCIRYCNTVITTKSSSVGCDISIFHRKI